MLQDTIPAHKGLTPSGKFTAHSSAFGKFICIFEIFLKLPNGCAHAHAGHTQTLYLIAALG